MHEALTQVRLRTGEWLDVMVVEAPDAEHAGTVLGLLSHKGELRQWQFEEDFAGRATGVRSRYYLGFIQGRPVANISVWESGAAGNLGHVYTLETQRRKGICRAVMGAQMEDFRARGGQLLVLGTGYDSAPYHIYRSFGFESLTPGSGSMAFCAQPAFFERYFQPAPVHCGGVEWRDLGTVCALLACPQGGWVRSVRARKFGPCCYEAAFLEDVRQALSGTRQVRVARTDAGAVAGYAVLDTDAAWDGSTALLDIFVHPAFAAAAAELVSGFSWPDRPVRCYLERDADVAAPLTAAGFRPEARLAACVQREQDRLDLDVYTRW